MNTPGIICSVVLALMLTGCGTTSPKLNPDFAFVHVNVVDLEAQQILTDQIVLIEGQGIVAVGDFSKTIIAKDVATLFAEGHYLVPRCINYRPAPKRSQGSDQNVNEQEKPAGNGTTLLASLDIHRCVVLDDPQLIAPGYPAELLLVAENPLLDLTKIKSIEGVYSKGVWREGKALAPTLEEAENLRQKKGVEVSHDNP